MLISRLKRLVRRRRASARAAAEVFAEVYENNRWGGGRGEYCSGPGSHADYAQPYGQLIKEFVDSTYRGTARIVDLGCGDFRVGQMLTDLLPGITYIGVDIVPGLIERNTRRYGGDRVTFVCRDIVQDDLPEADVCLVRQVFQHLSNQQIMTILAKLVNYRYVFVTEHYPGKIRAPNINKPHGYDTRRKDRSAIFLDKPPFNVTDVERVLTTPYRKSGEELRVFKIEHPRQPLSISGG